MLECWTAKLIHIFIVYAADQVNACEMRLRINAKTRKIIRNLLGK